MFQIMFLNNFNEVMLKTIYLKNIILVYIPYLRTKDKWPPDV